MPLIVYNNISWHNYRSITETTILMISVTLICLLHQGGLANMYWQKIILQNDEYVTSNNENFKYLHLHYIFIV